MHYFENFKKRWSKKKNTLKKVHDSGTSTTSVKKVKKNLELYLFFSWCNDFIRPRASKANIADDGLSDCESDSIKDIEEQQESKKKTKNYYKVISWKRVKLQKMNTLLLILWDHLLKTSKTWIEGDSRLLKEKKNRQWPWSNDRNGGKY